MKALNLYFHLTKKSGVIRLRNGFKFMVRPGKNDIQTIIEQFIGQVYVGDLNQLPEDAVVLDIGANIGTFTVFITKYTRERFKVFSYEPYPDNFKLLERNIELNKLEPNVNVFQCGVGRKKEIRELYISEEGNAYHSMYFKNEKNLERKKILTIQVLSLKNVFENNNIDSCDFLKIDCEGAEYEILYNTQAEIYDRIKHISIEYHPVEGYTLSDLQKFLEEHGYELKIDSKASDYGYIYATKK